MKPTRPAHYVGIITGATLIVLSCSCATGITSEGAAGANEIAPNTEEPATVDSNNAGVSGLPFARGASFRCLDDYLAHLQRQGAIDLPWWREISPGVYEHVTRMTGAQREVATRAELMQRFGFTC